MIKIYLPVLLLLILAACGSQPQPKNVSGPAEKPVVGHSADTLPVTVTTTNIPVDILVFSTKDAESKTDQAMNEVLKRLKGTIVHQPMRPAGDAALAKGGLLNMNARIKKMGYLTSLSGTGTVFHEDIYIRLQIVSLEFPANDPETDKSGRLALVNFPVGNKMLRIGDGSAVFNSNPAFSYNCKIGLKVLGMLKDGTYAETVTFIAGTVIIPDDFQLKLLAN